MPRRRPGTLVPIETEILRIAAALHRHGETAFHGFGLAQVMRDAADARTLTAHGTLYKALGRLEEFGLLRSAWEPDGADGAPATPGRPRRRLYALTTAGAAAAAALPTVPSPATVTGPAARAARTRPAGGVA